MERRYWWVGHNGQGILTVRFVLRMGVIRVIGAGYWRKGRQIEKKKINYSDDRGED